MFQEMFPSKVETLEQGNSLHNVLWC